MTAVAVLVVRRDGEYAQVAALDAEAGAAWATVTGGRDVLPAEVAALIEQFATLLVGPRL